MASQSTAGLCLETPKRVAGYGIPSSARVRPPGRGAQRTWACEERSLWPKRGLRSTLGCSISSPMVLSCSTVSSPWAHSQSAYDPDPVAMGRWGERCATHSSDLSTSLRLRSVCFWCCASACENVLFRCTCVTTVLSSESCQPGCGLGRPRPSTGSSSPSRNLQYNAPPLPVKKCRI